MDILKNCAIAAVPEESIPGLATFHFARSDVTQLACVSQAEVEAILANSHPRIFFEVKTSA